MKNLGSLVPILLVVIVLQSIFIFSAFTPVVTDEVVQSYKIEKKYSHGQYFYVLVSGGEAVGLIKE